MKIVYNGETDGRALKDVISKTIQARLERDENAVYLDADLMMCIGMGAYAQKHPERAINCGVAEANMVGVACGLSAAGFKPLVHSFGAFASRRCFDQVFLSGGYAGNDVTVLGSDPGVCAAFNGGTHMPFEDMALYRAIPGATVMDVSDAAMCADVIDQCFDLAGVKYVRTTRKTLCRLYEDGQRFQIGKAITLREGKDVALFACGIMVAEAMKAADRLATEGISAAVVDLFTVKPLDREAVAYWAQTTGAVVTCENHNRIGGLHSAVTDALAGSVPVPAGCVAVEDVFGEVGPQDYLQKRFGLTAENIVFQAKETLKRKAG